MLEMDDGGNERDGSRSWEDDGKLQGKPQGGRRFRGAGEYSLNVKRAVTRPPPFTPTSATQWRHRERPSPPRNTASGNLEETPKFGFNRDRPRPHEYSPPQAAGRVVSDQLPFQGGDRDETNFVHPPTQGAR